MNMGTKDFMEARKEEIEAFFSKTDFDFSSPAGWKEFLAERAQGGTGRDADGIQIRDIKNYAVGNAFVATTGQPVTAHFHTRTLGTGLKLPSGVLYVYYPDENWDFKVKTFLVGPPYSSQDDYLSVGGKGTPSAPYWGSLYYVILKSDELPAKGAAEFAGKKILNETLKQTGWLARRGFKLLSMGEAGYSVSVKVGSSPWVRDYFMPQEVLSPDAKEKISKKSAEVWESVRGYGAD